MKKSILYSIVVLTFVLTFVSIKVHMHGGLIRHSALENINHTSEDVKSNIGGPFTLVDHKGHIVTHTDFSGRYILVYFGYTFCPDICPTALQTMMNAYDQLLPEWQTRITPLFITVDPERDTVEQMRDYVTAFHHALIGLTGTLEQTTAAAKMYKVFFAKVWPEEDRSYYLVDHSSIIYLMDPQGHYYTHFSHGISAEALLIRLKSLPWPMG